MQYHPVLLLNASYEPLNVISWERAIRLIHLEKVESIESLPVLIRSPSTSIPLPAVVRLFRFVGTKFTSVIYSRWNMFVRDDFTCQYCGKQILNKAEITRDHIKPRRLGGINSWTNCVTCCKKCNLRKGGRTLGEARMVLIKKPRQPRGTRVAFDLKKRKHIPSEWTPYISYIYSGNPGQK